MNPEQQRFATFQRLKHALQALAIAAEEQVRLFPDFVVKTDELVCDFDDWMSCAIENYGSEMTKEQLQSLAVLDTHIEAGDKRHGKSIWEEESLYSHPFWQELREMSSQALKAFDWPLVTPPSYAHEYVRGRELP